MKYLWAGRCERLNSFVPVQRLPFFLDPWKYELCTEYLKNSRFIQAISDVANLAERFANVHPDGSAHNKYSLEKIE